MSFINPSPIVGTMLILMLGFSFLAFAIAFTRKRQKKTVILTGVILAAIGFQLFHVFEHGLQLGYWVFNSDAKPWLTPWAETGRNGLAFFCNLGIQSNQVTSCGAELLHLVGNGIFLSGVLAMATIAKMSKINDPVIKGTVFFQGFHFAEHCTLTLTLIINGKAWGFSTLFGLLSGSELSTYRVWWHFGINAIATALGVMAAKRLYSAGVLTIKPQERVPSVAVRRFGLLWIMVAGIIALEGVPLLFANLTGEPSSPQPKVRNSLLSNPLNSGEWWQIFDPYLLATLSAIVFFVLKLKERDSLEGNVATSAIDTSSGKS
jgi:hypothetical protein